MQKNTKQIGFLYGNLLDFPYGINTIAHCCNTMNVMGAGIAEQIADRYPNRDVVISVAEDNENGCEIIYEKNA